MLALLAALGADEQLPLPEALGQVSITLRSTQGDIKTIKVLLTSYIFLFACMRVCMFVRLNLHMHACLSLALFGVCVCVYVCVCV
jgi:hypothetical protein